MTRRELMLPDLGIDGQPIVLSVWLVACDSRVAEGEPIVEVLCGAATVDLPSPGDGILVEQLAAEDEPVHVGRPLAVIELS